MSWTAVSKPTDSTYITINPQGKETYDQPSLTFDDSMVFYDGTDMDAWTSVSKPGGNTNVTILRGMTLGLIIPLTNALQFDIGADPWTRIDKPSN